MDIPDDDHLKALLEEDSLLDLLRTFSDNLSQNCHNDELYVRLRSALRRSPFRDAIPTEMQKARTLDELCSLVRAYSDFTTFRTEGLNPLIDKVEDMSDPYWFEYANHIRRLGEGGFGVVHLFEDPLLKLQYAVKFYHPSKLMGERELASSLPRFFQETGILAKLRHPNIPRVLAAGLANGHPYIKMDYFDGQSVREAVTDEKWNSWRLGKETITPFLRELCGALAHAHNHEIVHRDINPRNVMIGHPGRVALVDFGLGAYIEEKLTRITRSEDRFDNGAYMAPELYEDPLMKSERADLYSVGAVTYFALTGRPPQGIIGSLSELNLGHHLQRILQKCLDADPDARFQSATEIIDALNNPQEQFVVRTEEGVSKSLTERITQPQSAINTNRLELKRLRDSGSSTHGTLAVNMSTLSRAIYEAILEYHGDDPAFQPGTDVILVWEIENDNFNTHYRIGTILLVAEQRELWTPIDRQELINDLKYKAIQRLFAETPEESFDNVWFEPRVEGSLQDPPAVLANLMTFPEPMVSQPDALWEVSVNYRPRTTSQFDDDDIPF